MTFPATLATLEGLTLPEQFSYPLYIPSKRNSIIPTVDSVVVQAASPTQIVHGEDVIGWTCPSCTPAEFQALFTLYNTAALTSYTFVGYWGETLEVYFAGFSAPVRARLFNLSGQFQVHTVTANYSGVTCKTGL